MTYQIRLRPAAEKELNKIPCKDYKRIIVALVGLRSNPFFGKRLKGKYNGYFSIRVWPYRIIYQIYKKEFLILIIRIGQRQGIYK